MLKDFRDFILKGNAIDLAVGVLIGAAFQKVVTAVTDGVIKPILQKAGPAGNPDVTLQLWGLDIGLVINSMLSLVITGAILFFLFVKPMNKLKAMTAKPVAPTAPPEPTAEEKLLQEIRDLLKQGRP